MSKKDFKVGGNEEYKQMLKDRRIDYDEVPATEEDEPLEEREAPVPLEDKYGAVDYRHLTGPLRRFAGPKGVKTESLDDESVTTDKLEDGSVTLAKLGADIVASLGIRNFVADGAIVAGRAVYLTSAAKATQKSPLYSPRVTHSAFMDWNVSTAYAPQVCAHVDSGVVIMCAYGGTSQLFMRAVTLNRTTLTLTSNSAAWVSSSTNYCNAVYGGERLAANKTINFGAAYSTVYPGAFVINMSGGTPGQGTFASAGGAALTGWAHGCRVKDNEFLMAYSTGTSFYARYGTVSVATITWATEGQKLVGAIQGYCFAVRMLSSTKALILYLTSTTIRAVVATITGTGTSATLTFGTVYSVTPSSFGWSLRPSADAFWDGTKAVVLYTEGTSSPYTTKAYSLSIDLATDAITFVGPSSLGYLTVNTSSFYQTQLRKISETQLIARAHGYGIDTGYLWIIEMPTTSASVVGSVSPYRSAEIVNPATVLDVDPLFGAIEFGYHAQLGATYYPFIRFTMIDTNPVGIALQAAVDGASFSVQTQGVVSGLSGLTAGKEYFASELGALSAYRYMNKRIGHSLSATELLLRGD